MGIKQTPFYIERILFYIFLFKLMIGKNDLKQEAPPLLYIERQVKQRSSISLVFHSQQCAECDEK